MMNNTVSTTQEKSSIVNEENKISQALVLHDRFVEHFAEHSFLQLNNGQCGYVADAIAKVFDKIEVPYGITITCYEDDKQLVQNCIEDWKELKKLHQSEQGKLNIVPACTIFHVYVKLPNETLLDCYNQIDDELKTEMIDDYGYSLVDIPHELFNEWLVKLNWNQMNKLSKEDINNYIYMPVELITKDFIKNQENNKRLNQ